MKTTCLAALLLLLVASHASAQAFTELNKSSPGELFEVHHYLKRDKLNVVVFYSPRSAVCLDFLSKLDALAESNPNIQPELLNIDRSNTQGIDWRSPLARQKNLKSIPYVVIYEGKELFKEGYEARKFLLQKVDESN